MRRAILSSFDYNMFSTKVQEMNQKKRALSGVQPDIFIISENTNAMIQGQVWQWDNMEDTDNWTISYSR